MEQAHPDSMSFLTIALTSSGLIASLITLFLIFILLHFRRLNNAVNFLLANRCIGELIRFVFNPLTVAIVTNGSRESLLYCFTSDISSLVRIAINLFESFMVFDWMMENFFSNYLDRWRRYLKMIVTAVWAPVPFGCLWISGNCLVNYSITWIRMITGCVSLISVCFVVLLQITRGVLVVVKKRRTVNNCSINLATISAVSRVIAVVIMILSHWIPVFLLFEHLSMILFALYMYLFGENYAIYMKKTLTCDVKDDCPEEAQQYVCQGCGAYVGFEDLGPEFNQQNGVAEAIA